MKKIIFILGMIFTLTGCQTTIEANHYSVVDPETNFDAGTPIVVETLNENDLYSKYYVKKVITALKLRGFKNVYSKNQLLENKVTPRAVAYIKIEEDIKSYTYESADYGMVDTGQSATNCVNFGVTATCSTTKQKTLGVTGSSTKTGVINYHSFTLNYYDVATSKRVLFALGSTVNERCNKDFLYNFLIGETISRINIEKPLDYEYKIKLPEEVVCK